MNLRQIRTAFARPDIGVEYLQWQISKMVNGSARFSLPNGAVISNFISFSEYHSMIGCMSKAEIQFLRSLPVSDAPIVDVGANIGVVSLLLAKEYPNRRIFSLEPAPSTFAALQRNVALNGVENISLNQIALSDTVGEIPFNAEPADRGNSRLAGDGIARIATQGISDRVMVQTTTLDTFAEEHGLKEIGLLKIDVEGFEATVLRGARQVLQRRLPELIFMEVVADATISAGFPPALPIEIVSEAGYDWFRLEENGGRTPVSVAQVAQVKYENWIAVRAA